MEEAVTGTLEGWFVDSTTFKGYNVLRGHLINDIRKRWYEGCVIRTSAVQTKLEDIKEGAIIETENSLYLLGKEYVTEDS